MRDTGQIHASALLLLHKEAPWLSNRDCVGPKVGLKALL
jgi:hypothetical protein